MGYENIIVDRNEGVGVVTLNRPEVLNALSRDLYREIDEVISEFEADDDVKAIVFTGAGERAFSAGSGHTRDRAAARDAGPAAGYRGA